LAVVLGGFSGTSVAEVDPITGLSENWCGTQEKWEANRPARTLSATACPDDGICDDPVLRDSYFPDSTQAITYIRIFVHILRDSDGDNPACTEAQLIKQINRLNEDFLPHRIQFEWDWRFINSTPFRSLDQAEESALKIAHAIDPHKQLNVFVSYVEGGYSFGTFPWSSWALSATGGIIMTSGHFQSTQSTFAHEVGHCLGLWHTHHGISEVAQCGSCYEPPGTPNGDFVGDRCQDTKPTPTNNSCSQPQGTDPCNTKSYGVTDIQNYMGYSGEICWEEFSPQQSGRMHCWLHDRLSPWIFGVKFTEVNSFGKAPLSVDFTGISPKEVLSWDWEFGDGGGASVQYPNHIYNNPGIFDVTVSIEATDGSFFDTREDVVWIHNDLLMAGTTDANPGDQVRIDFSAVNNLPLNEIQIPVTYSGPLNMIFDYMSTEGLRTSFAEYQQTVAEAPGKVVVNLKSTESGSPPYFDAGVGPVVSLYFTIPPSAPREPNPIVIEPLSVYDYYFETMPGVYQPSVVSGGIEVCIGGDADGDGLGPDLSDLGVVVDYLFVPGAPPPPAERTANVDGIGGIDLSDLGLFVDYLFVGQIELLCGPLE
jgi:PKD repeat protein